MAKPKDFNLAEQFGYNAGDYGSEFEFDEEQDKRKRARDDLATKSSRSVAAVPSKRLVQDEYSREEGKAQRFHFLALTAYGRHKELVNNYLLYYPDAKEQLFKRNTQASHRQSDPTVTSRIPSTDKSSANDKTDLDVIRENHRFLWEPKDEAETSWAKKLAKRYWDKLFKEYCITDLSRYKENKIALRWRIEKEVAEGKGHFSCGNKRCAEQEGLRSWEVNFAYAEHGEKKNALVKLRLCPKCSYKLNYHHKRRDVTRHPTERPSSKEDTLEHKRSKRKHRRKEKHKHKKHRKKQRRESPSPSSSSEESEEESSQDAAGGSGVSDSKFWSGPAPVVDDKSRDDEFEDYFQDIFL